VFKSGISDKKILSTPKKTRPITKDMIMITKKSLKTLCFFVQATLENSFPTPKNKRLNQKLKVFSESFCFLTFSTFCFFLNIILFLYEWLLYYT
jgi:hypothetical protein